MPAILTTNGFGGSKDDQAGIGKAFASRGYEVLSYSGLGFGGSGCKITLDDPRVRRPARANSWSASSAARPASPSPTPTHTTVAPLRVVVHDARDHAGHGRHLRPARRHDRRLVRRRQPVRDRLGRPAHRHDRPADHLERPDLLPRPEQHRPDARRHAPPTRAPSSSPGACCSPPTASSTASQGGQQDPSRLVGCPNFPTFVCPALVTGGTTGYFQPDALADFRHASVASYMKKITIPTLLIQGENDTLFNLNEAVATYRALRAQGTPVKMIWQSWGHSQSTPAPGEINLADPNPATQYETRASPTGSTTTCAGTQRSAPGRSSPTSATGCTTPASRRRPTRSADHFPVGHATQSTTCPATARLRAPTDARRSQSGAQNFVTPPAGPPTSVDPVDVVGSFSTQVAERHRAGPAGTPRPGPARRSTRRLDVVGSPTLTVQISAPSAAATQAAGSGRPAGAVRQDRRRGCRRHRRR